MKGINSAYSKYVTMPDGVKIALDLWLPDDLKSGQKLTTMIEFTRYWRSIRGKGPRDRARFYPEEGFASVVVDCRGTGASFGSRKLEQSVSEISDFSHIIEWVSMQPWSNGSVVSIGSSYSANTAELAMVDSLSCLKACVARFSDFDFYSHLLFPGGLFNKAFTTPWSKGIAALDRNHVDDTHHEQWRDYFFESVNPVTEDECLLTSAIAEHHENISFDQFLRDVQYRDDFNFVCSLNSNGDSWLAPYLVQENIRVRKIPSYHWASFNDAGTAAGAIARFVGSDAPMTVVIGWWSHGAAIDTNPFNLKNTVAVPSYKEQFQHILACLSPSKDPEGGDFHLLNGRNLYYFTAGVDVWQKTSQWPPNGISYNRLYLSGNGQLVDSPSDIQMGKDVYEVDFDIGTGTYSRWNQMVEEVEYGDRQSIDERLLTYTSQPLKHDIEITGHPIVSLKMSSDQSDGAIIAYLEVVDANGTAIILTEGVLRLIHRQVADKKDYYSAGPYHSFLRKDAIDMPISKFVMLSFEMLPLSVVVKHGCRLRLSLAGHDKDSFDKVCPKDSQIYEVCLDDQLATYIDIPQRSFSEEDVFGDDTDSFLSFFQG